jgi:hypothetical protein
MGKARGGFLIRVLGFFAVCVSLPGCGFLPGFGLLEQPTLYYLDVAEVATQVACELEEFVAQHKDDPLYTGENPKVPYHKWVLADDDIAVKLTLQTDEAGYVISREST